MKKLKKQISKIILFSFFSLLAQNSLASNSRNLTIFAEQNMVRALTKIVNLYSKRNNVTVLINFNSSSELINEIEEGEPADVFITGHTGLIDTLKHKGLIDVYNINNVASDRLKLVTLKTNPDLDVKLFKEDMTLEKALQILNSSKASIIIDQEESTSGLSSDNLIESLKLKKIKLFQKLPEDKTSIFNIVNNDPRNYALLLSSQVKNREDLMVIAQEAEANIFYKSLVIAGNNMEISREFLQFLKSDEVRKIFEENSFIVN